VGTALSPEYIFAGLWGMPDQRGFGVFWVDREALAAAYDMQGAFNRRPSSWRPARQSARVIDACWSLLAPYGGRDVIGRADQVSHAMLDNEIKEQRVLGTVLPAIFLAVAAFLLQRGGVAPGGHAARADRRAEGAGLSQRGIAAHYLELVLLIVAVGLVLGWRWATGWAPADRAVRRVLPLPALRPPHRAGAAGDGRGHTGHRGAGHAVAIGPPCGWRRPRPCARRPGPLPAHLLSAWARRLPPRCA
jgi:hypothetical protein